MIILGVGNGLTRLKAHLVTNSLHFKYGRVCSNEKYKHHAGQLFFSFCRTPTEAMPVSVRPFNCAREAC